MKIRLFLTALAVCIGASSAQANVIVTATGPFTPSFRGAASTTYFGWNNGSWDGNDDVATTVDTLNGFPSINPGSLAGPLLVQTSAADIVSGSNNVYTSPANLKMMLSIPTAGTPGTGFTTIIVQGNSLAGGGFGGLLDTAKFGTIEGVAPTYVYGGNASTETQFWAKWELPGNSASYSVDITGTTTELGVASLSDMVVDTQWSPNGYAIDTAAAVPEPTSFALVGAALTFATALVRRRR